LHAAAVGAEQKGDEDRKGKNALSGKRLGAGSVGVDEVGIVQGFGNIVDNCGMNIVSPNSFFYLIFHIFKTTLYHNFLT